MAQWEESLLFAGIRLIFFTKGTRSLKRASASAGGEKGLRCLLVDGKQNRSRLRRYLDPETAVREWVGPQRKKVRHIEGQR